MDDCSYPTEDALGLLKRWSSDHINEALDYARSLWNVRYGTMGDTLNAAESELAMACQGDRFVRFATGGWSGNEAIIAALHLNRALTVRTWRLSRVGGLHIYRYLPWSDYDKKWLLSSRDGA